MNPYIKINGTAYPYPRRGLEMVISTLVDAGRNANGVTVGQVIGRQQQKLKNLEWGYMDAETWSKLLHEFDNFYVEVSYPDMLNNAWTTRKMYPNDRSAAPLWLDEETGLPKSYINCKVNLIDCGEI